MSIRIALAGNPNCGKTTLFNALTGSNQFVGNWPGVTVEKKEGKLKGEKEVTITDLPGIYSLSPYTLEEVVARNYLINEKPDAILNIVDGTNIERNLYLSTQLMELGIPVVMAVNMMDIVKKSGDSINISKLSEKLGCKVVEISALKGDGIDKAAKMAIEAAKSKQAANVVHRFSEDVENIITQVEGKLDVYVERAQKRFFAIKLLERDDKIGEQNANLPNVDAEIKTLEDKFDDDTESIITNERYTYISSIINDCVTKKPKKEKLTTSDKIDKVVTNRWLALPIFAVVMFIVYYVSVTTVGSWATDWANDGVFGDGWHLFGIGSSSYEEDAGKFDKASQEMDGFLEAAEAAGVDTSSLTDVLDNEEASDEEIANAINEFVANDKVKDLATDVDITEEDEVVETVKVNADEFKNAADVAEPDPADYGVWVPGVPVIIEAGLDKIHCVDWLKSLILDGIVAGVGAVLGFVPQMLVLFIFLAFLESCGYMARVAFIMDRIFRKFGLSGKSFIPMLIGSGCGVPGVMASRTIENDRDRKMTIMTTTFVPCGAKLPIIALIAGALFDGAAWVAPSAYFVGIAAIILSGIILKKTKMFAGDPAPFVMELPAYHMPTVSNVLRSMWERAWSFIKKAGTIILLSTVLLWFLMSFGWVDGKFKMLEAVELDNSILARIGSVIAPIFKPLGWGNWKMAVAAVTGLIAKENVVGTFGVLFGGLEEVAEDGNEIWAALAASMSAIAGYSFLVFNLLCAPCFAAMGAIKREMNNAKWFWFAIGYQCVLAYIVSLCIYQIGSLIISGTFGAGTVVAFLFVLVFLFLLFRPYKQSETLNVKVKTSK